MINNNSLEEELSAEKKPHIDSSNHTIPNDGLSGYVVSKPEVNIEVTNNFKPLSSKEAKLHLNSLDNMLKQISRFMYDTINDQELRNNALIQNYILRLGDTLHAVILKNDLEGIGVNSDLQQNIVIDPSQSGFPLVARDISMLHNDKEHASEMLQKIPSDSELVDAAITSSFYKQFPNKQIRQMHEKNYYSSIDKIDFPKGIELYDAVYVKETDTGAIYKKSMAKLDSVNNIPRFYTVYFEVPKASYSNGRLSEELKSAIVNDGLQTITSHELPYLAKKIEEIDGIQVQLVRRFDLGPFYNKFTENPDAINRLLEDSSLTEGIISFTKNDVIRESEMPVKGFKNYWSAMFSGDNTIGRFSDILSKTYMIMPHRLVQKATRQRINLGNVELVGVTMEGDFS